MQPLVQASALRPRLKGALRRLVARFTGSQLYFKAVNPIRGLWRSYGLIHGLRAFAYLCEVEVRARIHRHRLKVLSEEEVAARRRSDTVFVFGSGASLNEISDAEWHRIGQHDVIGLNYFVRQRWVDVGFHYIRELELPFRRSGKYDAKAVVRSCRDFCDLVAGNGHYRETVLFLQHDFFAEIGKTIVGRKMLPPGQAVCFYKGLRRDGLKVAPPRDFGEGLPRQAGAIGGGVSIGRSFGWKRIVLVGVDLYDARYFWLPPDSVRGDVARKPSDRHGTVGRGIVEIMENWATALRHDGISLEVYNPKSLLRPSLPQFRWDDGLPVHAAEGG